MEAWFDPAAEVAYAPAPSGRVRLALAQYPPIPCLCCAEGFHAEGSKQVQENRVRLQRGRKMALNYEEIEAGSRVTHRNTGLRYSVVEPGDEEILLTPDAEGAQDLLIPVSLFTQEFVCSDRFRDTTRRGGSKGRKTGVSAPAQVGKRVVTGPKLTGRIKKMVRDRGFGFIRGDDGKEVFFHRSGLNAAEYDVLEEGAHVEYQISESPRGPRAENVRPASAS